MLQQIAPGLAASNLPSWVPAPARHYLAHTEVGLSIRALARADGCHASTVLRQIRRVENLRDDVLVDEALRILGKSLNKTVPASPLLEPDAMTANKNPLAETPDEATLAREGLRILRRLCETGAILAVAADMDKAVIVRDTGDGTNSRTAVFDRPIAQAMALKDWIACAAPGRISRYHITPSGRIALNQMLAASENRAVGFAESQTAFAEPESGWQLRDGGNDTTDHPSRRVRYNLAESPLAALARRRDKDGARFLSDEMVRAGERLREDFELAQMGPRVAQNWDRFLTGSVHGGGAAVNGVEGAAGAARLRVEAALRDLGPGLGDAVLRCCCYLQGLETAEKRMGWSARSGKIVLRIALQRLIRHYEIIGDAGKMIG